MNLLRQVPVLCSPSDQETRKAAGFGFVSYFSSYDSERLMNSKFSLGLATLF